MEREEQLVADPTQEEVPPLRDITATEKDKEWGGEAGGGMQRQEYPMCQ